VSLTEGAPVNQASNSPRPTRETAVTVERRGRVLLMGLNGPAKRNAFNLVMLEQLAAAYYELEADDDLRYGVLFTHGEHFTARLDLAEVARGGQGRRAARWCGAS
jgi:enoyl-CoA hydratase/carnithine racemase